MASCSLAIEINENRIIKITHRGFTRIIQCFPLLKTGDDDKKKRYIRLRWTRAVERDGWIVTENADIPISNDVVSVEVVFDGHIFSAIRTKNGVSEKGKKVYFNDWVDIEVNECRASQKSPGSIEYDLST